MKIYQEECYITKILLASKGKIPPSKPHVSCRYSDCFVYVLSGEAFYTFEGQEYKVEQGDVFYLGYRTKYDISVFSDNYTFIFVDFFFDCTQKELPENEVFHSPKITLLENDFIRLQQLWNRGSSSDKIACTGLLYTIFEQLVREKCLHNFSHERLQKMEKAIQYISEHISDRNLTVNMLARQCGISEVHFRRLFEQIYQISPAKYLICQRINLAKQELTFSSRPIYEIAEQSGFENAYYFSRVFKSVVGMTPKQFRQWNSAL